MGLLLALVRRIPAEQCGLRRGQWGSHVGETLEGKTLGVLGLGQIGRSVAAYGRAFGMDVVAHSRNLASDAAGEIGCRAVDRDTLLREADVVSVHLSLTPETRGFVGREELGSMKSTAVLVNTARGAIVDEAALVDALRTGSIGGAALDVFEREPLPPQSPLLSLDNIVLTPHIGYVTADRYRTYFEHAAQAILRYVRGDALQEIA